MRTDSTIWRALRPGCGDQIVRERLRIPDEKITLTLFGRMVRLEHDKRLRMADGGIFPEFNRVWAAMLEVVEADPAPHLDQLRRHLPGRREEVRKQGGPLYAAARDALSRRENELSQQALRVDANWDLLPE